MLVAYSILSQREYSYNKKVLLRERKRHTARCVASTRRAGRGGTLGGAPLPVGGYPGRGSPANGGVPQAGPPCWGGTPGGAPLLGGVLRVGPHHQLDGVPPPHHELDGVPPSPPWAGWGTPLPTMSWMGYPSPLPSAGWGTPPPRVWTDTQSENITSSRTTYAVGKKYLIRNGALCT